MNPPGRGAKDRRTVHVEADHDAADRLTPRPVKEVLIRSAVRARFRIATRRGTAARIRRSLHAYLALAASLRVPEDGRRPVRVPPMLGVDEDMRDWSFFMILEHNAIVNRGITRIVHALAKGDDPDAGGPVDMKHDVMPSADPGPGQVDAFRETVEDHLGTVEALPGLRGTATKRHPVFGELDAHGWHGMFGLHLEIHLSQAREVVRSISEARG